jgi:hypothetical protein
MMARGGRAKCWAAVAVLVDLHEYRVWLDNLRASIQWSRLAARLQAITELDRNWMEPPMKALFLVRSSPRKLCLSSNSSLPTSVPKSSIATNRHRPPRRSPMRMFC